MVSIGITICMEFDIFIVARLKIYSNVNLKHYLYAGEIVLCIIVFWSNMICIYFMKICFHSVSQKYFKTYSYWLQLFAIYHILILIAIAKKNLNIHLIYFNELFNCILNYCFYASKNLLVNVRGSKFARLKNFQPRVCT